MNVLPVCNWHLGRDETCRLQTGSTLAFIVEFKVGRVAPRAPRQGNTKGAARVNSRGARGASRPTKPPSVSNASKEFNTHPTANRRYGRPEVCATIEFERVITTYSPAIPLCRRGGATWLRLSNAYQPGIVSSDSPSASAGIFR